MATESLIVELDARTAKLDAKLNSTNDKLDKLTKSAENSDSAFKNFTKTADKAGNILGGAALGAIALSGAVNAIVLASAKGRRELELLSGQARTTTSDFQALAFATGKYGIDADQIGDISKEISLKVAEFSTAGTGAFQDYADVMKLTKDEARSAAEEFQGLSSQEVLGTMISRMESAGATAGDMGFAIDSLASDAERIIPLFLKNSEELKELKKRFDDVNKSLQITGTQAKGLADLSTSFKLMTAQLTNATTQISATLAPVLDDFFNDVIDIVPHATQTIIDFANSLLAPQNIRTKAGFLQQISESQVIILEAQANLRQAEQDAAKFTGGMINTAKARAEGFEAIIRDEKTRTAELNEQLSLLLLQKGALDDVHRASGGQIGGETVTSVGPVNSGGLGTGEEVQAIADRFKLEETLLAEKLVRELQIIGDNNELKVELEKEFADNINRIREKSEKEKEKGDTKASKSEEKIESLKRSFAERTAMTLLSSATTTQQKLFSIVKDAAAGQIEAYGLTAGAKALAELGPIAGPPVAASYIGWSQVAAGIVRALPLGGGGGGTAPGNGSTQTQQTQPQPQQENFTPETSSLEFNSATQGGSTNINLTVPDGDEIGMALANWILKAQKEGRV
jgi:hypothetical protein